MSDDDDGPVDGDAEDEYDPLLHLEAVRLILGQKIEQLQTQVNDLQTALVSISTQAKVIKDAAMRWRVIGGDQRGVLLMNETGQLTPIPEDLLDVIAHRKRLDGIVTSQGADLVYTTPRGKVVIPKALVLRLQDGEADK